MGKRRKEQPPGADGKCSNPKTKRNLQGNLDVTGNNSLDVTGLAQSGDANGKPTSQGQTPHGSTGSVVTDPPGSTSGTGEVAAPERSRVGEHVPSPSLQEGRDTGIGGGGKSPEVAAPGAASQPASPRWVNLVVDETEEDQPVATAEQHRSTREELDAEAPTCCGTADTSDSPERGSAPPVWGEGAAGSKDAPPAGTPGPGTGSCPSAEGPDPPQGEGDDHSEHRGDSNHSQELLRMSVVNAEENESSTMSVRAAGGEHRESLSRERRATGTNNTVESVAEPWCGPAGAPGGSMGILGVCAPSADLKVEGGASEPENVGTASTAEPETVGTACTTEPETVGTAGTTEPETVGTAGTTEPETVGTAGTAKPESVGTAGTTEPESAGTAGTAKPESVGTAGTAELECWPQGENDSLRKTSGEANTGQEAAGGGEIPAPGTSSMPDPAVLAVGDPCGGSEGPVEDAGRMVSPRMDSQPPAHPSTSSAAGTEPRGQLLPATPQRNPVVPEPPATAGRGDATATSPCQPWPREDATDIVCGLILELSNLNRLAMSAHRGLEALRRPKLRQRRRPAPGLLPPRTGRWWKET